MSRRITHQSKCLVNPSWVLGPLEWLCVWMMFFERVCEQVKRMTFKQVKTKRLKDCHRPLLGVVRNPWCTLQISGNEASHKTSNWCRFVTKLHIGEWWPRSVANYNCIVCLHWSVNCRNLFTRQIKPTKEQRNLSRFASWCAISQMIQNEYLIHFLRWLWLWIVPFSFFFFWRWFSKASHSNDNKHCHQTMDMLCFWWIRIHAQKKDNTKEKTFCFSFKSILLKRLICAHHETRVMISH